MGYRPVVFICLLMAIPACRRNASVTEVKSRELPASAPAKGASATKVSSSAKSDQFVSTADPALSTAPTEFKTQVVPFIAKYCLACHSDKKKSAGLSLEKYQDEKIALKDRKVWQAVLENMHSREMPPAEAKVKPTPAEREKIEKIIADQLTQVNCGLARDPGQPTLRRLNRAEYANTIRDLVGVSFNPAEDFPSDDVGYGFDNIGDVLSMPPILMEKYLRAAERIMEEAIVVPGGEIKASRQQYRPQALQASFRGARDPAQKPIRMLLNQSGSVFTNYEPAAEGDYIIKVSAFAENTTGEAIKMAFQIDRKDVKTVEVKAGNQKTPEVFELKTKISSDRHNVAVSFSNPLTNGKTGEKRSLSITNMEIDGPYNPVPKPPTVAQKRIMIATPKTKPEEEAAARKILQNFAGKAYRRPVTTAEVDRLMKLYRSVAAEKEPFEKSISFALRAILVSPNFLFRVERDADPKAPKAVHLVNDYELASRLSYFIWSSMPDDALIQAAAKGTLKTQSVLDEQVKRMLKDPKAQALTENFASQWLQLRTLDMHIPDRRTFPGFNSEIKNLMVKETQASFDYVVKEDRSILEFLDSNYTFLNERLARFYGIGGVSGDELKKYTFESQSNPSSRGGLLTQGSILTLTSNPTRTSPVKRGKWILETILGTPPPPPPPDVPDLKEGSDANLSASLRQRMEKHRENAVCASCHSKMDPLGFGLENYSAIGAFRTFDGKFKIDATGTLPNGEKFDGPTQLRKVLLGKADVFRRNLADKMLTYSIGRGTEYYDKCALDEIVKATTAGNDHFSALVTAIATSEPFQKRRGKED